MVWHQDVPESPHSLGLERCVGHGVRTHSCWVHPHRPQSSCWLPPRSHHPPCGSKSEPGWAGPWSPGSTLPGWAPACGQCALPAQPLLFPLLVIREVSTVTHLKQCFLLSYCTANHSMALARLPESMQITCLETNNPTHGAERNVKHGQLPSQILSAAITDPHTSCERPQCAGPFHIAGRGDMRWWQNG